MSLNLYINRLSKLVDHINKNGESLNIKRKLKILRCCKNLIDKKKIRYSEIKSSKNIVINQYSCVAINDVVKLDIIQVLRVLSVSYKFMIKRSLETLRVCTNYRIMNDHEIEFRQIVDLFSKLIEKSTRKYMKYSTIMIMLLDNNGFVLRADTKDDDAFDSKMLLERSIMDEKMYNLMNEISTILNDDDNKMKEENDKKNEDGKKDVSKNISNENINLLEKSVLMDNENLKSFSNLSNSTSSSQTNSQFMTRFEEQCKHQIESQMEIENDSDNKDGDSRKGNNKKIDKVKDEQCTKEEENKETENKDALKSDSFIKENRKDLINKNANDENSFSFE